MREEECESWILDVISSEADRLADEGTWGV